MTVQSKTDRAAAHDTVDPTERSAVPADPGRAPAADDRLPVADRRPPATSRVLWLLLYALVISLMALRTPLLYDYLTEHRPAGMDAINDAELEALALKSGVFFAVVLTALVVALFFSVAAILEKNVFTARLTVRGNLSFGLFYLISAMCWVPANAISVAFDIVDPRKSLPYYAYVLAVGLAAPWLFRRTWWGLPRRKIVILFVVSLIMACFTIVG